MSGSIICGVDGTASAESAADVARRLGAELGLRLVFVRVVDAGTPEETTAAIAEQLEQAKCGRRVAGRGRSPGRPARRRRGERERAPDGRRLARAALIAARQRLGRGVTTGVLPGRRGAAGRRRLGGAARPRQGLRRRHRPPGARADGDADFAGGILRFNLAAAERGGAMPYESLCARRQGAVTATDAIDERLRGDGEPAAPPTPALQG